MKTFSTLILLIMLGTGSFAQSGLSSSAKAKAVKKAAAEAKMYNSKGFKTYKSNQSIENMLKDYYEQSYRETSPGERVYISSQGMAKTASAVTAFQKATAQANRRIPGLLQMYFNSWISADKRTTEKQKAALISAVNKSGKTLEQMVAKQTPDKMYRLLKEKSGKYQAVVRLLYNQQKLRNLARNEIIKTAKEQTNLTESNIRKYLHF